MMNGKVKKLSGKDKKELMEVDFQVDRIQVNFVDSSEQEKKKHKKEVLGIWSS
jgi:hypothetical protein